LVRDEKGEKLKRQKQQPVQSVMEFHISRAARQRYAVDETLFSFNGNVIFADLAASRQLAYRMNLVRETSDNPELVVNPGALFAMGMIDEITHVLFAQYRETVDPKVITDALQWFQKRVGATGLEQLLLAFVEKFPGTHVHRGEQTAEQWLKGATDGYPNRHAAFEELVMLWLANKNPAFKPFQELFDETNLQPAQTYNVVTAQLRDYFATRPPADPEYPNLIDMMRAPALVSPDSLSGQLEFVRRKWSARIGVIVRRLMLAADVLKEEDVAIWMRFHPPSEAAEAARRRRDQSNAPRDHRGEVLEFSGQQHEYERFSPDQDWMPNTVLIAKSTYVWLDQLSKRYQRHIHRLDQIPDEELETLAHRGFNALWLIGVWERSRASQTIKRLCGNADAVASAYSLYDYSIAADLGGAEAYRNLRDRADHRGIRLASDMVPNHMGIDSPWVIDHPEWFLSRGDSPYPAYRFDGPDLSNDGRVEIKIEDHYYEQSDAAVVFRRRDKWTGSTLYIYHGNDGTSFPWNDTAQLNYLSAQVREQVMQTILQVARQFPIIRFDAAMTLAKRHIQRLWFPAPGAGGAIPSRAEYSMTQTEFDAAIPHEFWREVVDRVAAEVPGTLLLAEAFWLMEGYFVRTLGMHRVYNSAFMVMLRDEDNAKYRSVLKNTMEFDPGIMKRYVNFMSNPDERTAIDQFGSDDKYFGVASMMATLPGLPMFGHGQVEGFTEKYGMEYYRPRYDETPNHWLVERHQREIAPLLHQRKLFAESEHFLLYDFWRPDGVVDENVFAYSNRNGDKRALVLFNNNYSSTRGTIHHSTNFAHKESGSIRQRDLRDGLGLTADGDAFVAFRDSSKGLEYIRRASEIAFNGFSVDLRGYGYCVLLDWRELHSDARHPWATLHDQLRGEGVPSLEEAFVDLQMKPVHDALYALLDPSLVRSFAQESQKVAAQAAVPKTAALKKGETETAPPVVIDLVKRTLVLLEESQKMLGLVVSSGAKAAQAELQALYARLLRLPSLEAAMPVWPEAARDVLPSTSPRANGGAIVAPAIAAVALRWMLPQLHSDPPAFERLHLRKVLAKAFQALQVEGEDSWKLAARVRLLLHPDPSAVPAVRPARTSLPEAAAHPSQIHGTLDKLADRMEHDPEVRWLTGVHRAGETKYFVKEPFEQLVWWMQLPKLLSAVRDSKMLTRITDDAAYAIKQAAAAGYDFEKLQLERGARAKLTQSQPVALRVPVSELKGKTPTPSAPAKNGALPPLEESAEAVTAVKADSAQAGSGKTASKKMAAESKPTEKTPEK
jgi:glycosidase